MELASIIWRPEILVERDYQPRVFSKKCVVFPLQLYLFPRHLMELLYHLVVIMGRLLDEAVISLNNCGSKTVIGGFNYLEVV